MSGRRWPNILITGTPGVGKTSLSKELVISIAAALRSRNVEFKHIPVSALIQDEKLYREWDDELNCSIFDEELVTSALGDALDGDGGVVVDFHSCDFMERAWFDLVVVLRADTEVLWKRLESRNYSETSIKGNVESEIFEVILDEAREAFGPTEDDRDSRESGDEGEESIEIMEMRNNTLDDLMHNCTQVLEWIGRKYCYDEAGQHE